MGRVTQWLTNRGIGEMAEGRHHFPEYTEGCWGKPHRKLCWWCKLRYITALVRIFRRHSSTKS